MNREVKDLYITLLSKRYPGEYALSVMPPRVDLFLDRQGKPVYRYYVTINCYKIFKVGDNEDVITNTREISLGADYEPDELQSKADLFKTLG